MASIRFGAPHHRVDVDIDPAVLDFEGVLGKATARWVDPLTGQGVEDPSVTDARDRGVDEIPSTSGNSSCGQIPSKACTPESLRTTSTSTSSTKKEFIVSTGSSWSPHTR